MASVRVLIVDDEALARQRVRRLLQSETDVEIVGEAESGREAVQMIRELQPDLVCLDVQMPELDGFGVLRELDGENAPVELITFGTVRETCPHCPQEHLKLVLRQRRVRMAHLFCATCQACFDAHYPNGAPALSI